jgi:hypothetical protein
VRLKLADRNAGNDCIVEGAFNPQTLSPQCLLFVIVACAFFPLWKFLPLCGPDCAIVSGLCRILTWSAVSGISMLINI